MEKPYNPFAWENLPPEQIMEALAAFFGKVGYALAERRFGGITMMCLHRILDDGRLDPVLWIKECIPNHNGKRGSLVWRTLNQEAKPPAVMPEQLNRMEFIS
jgi:hypothetical protein